MAGVQCCPGPITQESLSKMEMQHGTCSDTTTNMSYMYIVAWLYVCLYVCMRVCMWVRTYVRTHACILVCDSAKMCNVSKCRIISWINIQKWTCPIENLPQYKSHTAPFILEPPKSSCSACRNRNTFKSKHLDPPHVAAFPATKPSSCAQTIAISCQYSSLPSELCIWSLTKLSLAVRKSLAFTYSGLLSFWYAYLTSEIPVANLTFGEKKHHTKNK